MKKTILPLLAFLVICFFSKTVQSQVFINEVTNANGSNYYDDDGETYDWIELYNAGSTKVNLGNYALSDNPAKPKKWIFPNLEINPQSYLVLLASGKDTSERVAVDHWETVIFNNDSWNYFVGTSEPDANWINLNFNPSGWPTGPGGFGFGDGDDNTIIPQTTSVYLRKEFNIVDINKIASAILHMDYDDAFIAYLNGVEIARKGISGTRPAYNDPAQVSHDATMYLGLPPEAFSIDPQTLNTLLKQGKNVLAIQVHNTPASTDLSSNAFLSLGINDESTDYRPVASWFSLTSNNRHTNFKLSSEGEDLVLSDPDGNIIDSYRVENLQPNHSYGRNPDGSANWCLFNYPTPEATNNSSTCYDGYEPDPVFSNGSGFYTSNLNVELYTPSPTGIIRYSLDGGFPNSSSNLYSSPFNISSTKVVTAKCYSSGNRLPSKTVKMTYFVNETGLDLPIFSITLDPTDLWDYNTGMYVMGPDASPSPPHYGANFWKDWEKKCHIEYFDKQKVKQFELEAGLKIHGGFSRAKPQRSFRVLSRGDYGTSWIDYPLISEKSNIESYKRFNLRNGGSDYGHTRFRDAFMQWVLKDANVDRMGYEPALVFLNGEYWGEYEIREKQDEKYIESNTGIPAEMVDVVIHRGYIKALHGSASSFISMHSAITTANAQSPTFLSDAGKMLDLGNFVDYFIGQTYYSNEDWIPRKNNIKFWKSNLPGGRWRYVFWDLDQASGLYTKSPTINRLPIVIDPNGTDGPNEHSDMLRKLLTNTQFKNYFVNRYADLMNTAFQLENVKNIAYAMRDSIESSMPRHCDRWNEQTYLKWQDYVNAMVKWHEQRLGLQRGYVQQQFNLSKQVDVTLATNPPEAGRIRISTIMPESLPWSGVYYNGVPVTITAIPNPGFTFEYWGANGNISSPHYTDSLTIDIKSDDTFTAYFSGSAIEPKLAFSEINYHSEPSLDAGDWVEIHNYDDVAINLTGWYIRNSDNTNSFKIPFGTVIPAKGYMVFCSDTANFKSRHPYVANYVGQLPFNLKNSTDQVRLFKYDNTLFKSVTYSDAAPWPKAADGKGRTLELKDPDGDPNLASNWFSGCVGGSPGRAYDPNCSTDIEEILADNKFKMKVWPNPSSGQMRINVIGSGESLGDMSFSMYDYLGKEVKSISSLNNNEIIVGSGEFPPGIYVIKVGNDKSFVTEKVIFR